HGQGFDIAAGAEAAVLTPELGRAGGAARGQPAGVGADLVGDVIIGEIGDVLVGIIGGGLVARIGPLGGAAELVNDELGEQVQAAAGRGGPQRRQVLEVAGEGGVHVGDGLGDSAGGGVVGGVAQEAGAVLGPDGAAVGVVGDLLHVRGAGPVLAGGD